MRLLQGMHSRNGAIVLLLAPFMLLYLVFWLAPAGYAAYQSLFGLVRTGGAFAPPEEVFVGLENYARALSDPVFLESLVRVVVYFFGPSLVLMVMGLGLALLIDSLIEGRASNVFRTVFFAPYAVPVVVGGIMWGFLYAPSTSPLVAGLAAIGIEVEFLAAGNAIWAVGNIAIWTYAGYTMMIFLAALRAIDPTIIEAARMDGASGWRLARHIKLPLVRPAIYLILIFLIIGTVQLFTEPQVIRAISSGITSTWTPVMFAYQQSASNLYNYSAAVSVLIAAFIGALSFGLMRLTWRTHE